MKIRREFKIIPVEHVDRGDPGSYCCSRPGVGSSARLPRSPRTLPGAIPAPGTRRTPAALKKTQFEGRLSFAGPPRPGHLWLGGRSLFSSRS